ncbi:hypothetical protein SLA2020_286950, partial [Shorea laevis]
VRGSTSQLSRDELAMAICRVLDSDKPGEEIAGDLLDLVGDSAFETVQDVMSHRKELVDAIHHGFLALKSEKNGYKYSITYAKLWYSGYGHYPPTPTAQLKPGEKLIEIKELDDFAQAAFHGYKSLNRIQSRIFQTVYYTNENILVCAPTGAGKTNIAMISILHEIGQHFKDGYLHKDEFKIVYVAPMKALAAEVTSAFSNRLSPLNMTVRELTGDMQLSKKELEETQMIVTTPEKWDVITRKSSDMSLSMLVKLLIIDEVHLLNDDRGPVIEALVARTLRQVESTQTMIRIVGLSATLPNYLEVAQFLRVNPEAGLFFFDSSYRPVPLAQQYIGISEQNFAARNELLNDICYKKVVDSLRQGHQAMVFVHSRKDTAKTAQKLVELGRKYDGLEVFKNDTHPQFNLIKREVVKSRNKDLVELFEYGIGVHHAGMLRTDRGLTERLFSDGLLKVLVCTATLAWGVNLPAHTVVIKGTQLYDPKAGGWRDLGMLDVMQIFGRAGRPQFDKSGEGIIITSHEKLAYYLRLLTSQLPIESQFITSLKDNLNAEVALGTVTNVKEACAWLGYTYLFIRMRLNPLAYGIGWDEVIADPSLSSKQRALVTDAARALDKAKMMRVETYNEMLRRHMNDSEVIDMVAHSSEFENIAVREEEQNELEMLVRSSCPLEIKGGPSNKHGKISILIQLYISRGWIDTFSLVSDAAYISASLARIMRALFEICLRRGWCEMSLFMLEYCKAVDRQIWPHQHPLRQFDKDISSEIYRKLEERGADLDRLQEMEEKDIGALIRYAHGGKLVRQYLGYFPWIQLSATVSPITRTVLKVDLLITPDFTWKDRFHGAAERWWILVEDSENDHIYHSELFTLTKRMARGEPQKLSFTVPIFEPHPPQYYIRAVSDSWLHAEAFYTISFQNLALPEAGTSHTELLDLKPLPLMSLGNSTYEALYKFSHFNPIQTQTFHVLYHSDNNVLLGAPTGSGKTISAELAMLRLFNTQPDMKVIYIAPLKAIVRERMNDWKKRLVSHLGKKMVEMTGDYTPDLMALLSADIIISTPEKWDGISRNWHSRSYVMKVGLMILDEIHLLGADRGPILEVIVSRMRYISSQTERAVRFVGLSTALANAGNLADWLGVGEIGLFNFKPSVRPVPLEVHIQGYPGKFYCPRMNSMNKPAYAAICTHSPTKPVLIFVSSRRQTRLTALDLIQFAASDEHPIQFLNMPEEALQMVLSQVTDQNLRHTLQFGIGLHHAGLNDKDRSLVEELFANNKIQVLVCTSTLAWGVNLPAHLVIIKGTEYYDGKAKRYVDFPITDILQMMGRAGRPQFDQHGKAVILVHEPKRASIKSFCTNHFQLREDAVHYLTWTYLFRRLTVNPAYYGLEGTGPEILSSYLSRLVQNTFEDLEDSGCIKMSDDSVEPMMLGSIASQYYLSYMTVSMFGSNIGPDTSLEVFLHILSAASEYDELPVRHNEPSCILLMGYVGYFYVETKSFEIRSGVGNGGFQLSEWSKGIVRSVVMSFQTVVWMLKMVEELWSGDPAADFCRSRRTGDTVIVLQKRQNDFGRFLELTEYGGGRRRSHVIIPQGRDGSGWHHCISQLRKLVKHVEQKGGAGRNVIPLPVQSQVVEQGGKTFAEVLVGEGQNKELEKRNEGGLGKADQNLGKRIVDPRNLAPAKSAPGITATEDLVGQAGMVMAKTVMEGNVTVLRDILISFKSEVERCLQQLELGQPFCQVGPDSNQSQRPLSIGECSKSFGPRDLGFGETLMDNRVAQHRTHRFGEVYHRRLRPRSVTHWRAKKAVVATAGLHQKLPVVNPVVSAAGDGSTASGEVVFPSGEGVLGSDTVSNSTMPQGGGPGLSTDAADVQIQGRTEGGAP